MSTRSVDGVCYIRTLAEADALEPRLAAAQNIVVIGAGFIGLEFAAVASAQGKSVTVLEMTGRDMARVVRAYFRVLRTLAPRVRHDPALWLKR